jgi:hypothetical protein
MPIPVKPCEGRLSETTKILLRTGRDRAAWGVHSCEICGQMVGVLEVNGDWIPETHWPSVNYASRKGSTTDRQRAKAAPVGNSTSVESEDDKSEPS